MPTRLDETGRLRRGPPVGLSHERQKPQFLVAMPGLLGPAHLDKLTCVGGFPLRFYPRRNQSGIGLALDEACTQTRSTAPGKC